MSSAGGMTTEDESINEIMETSDDTSGVGVSDMEQFIYGCRLNNNNKNRYYSFHVF